MEDDERREAAIASTACLNPKFTAKPQLSKFQVAGGDGTAGWIVGVISDLNLSQSPPVAILPLGTEKKSSICIWLGKEKPWKGIAYFVEDFGITLVWEWILKYKDFEGKMSSFSITRKKTPFQKHREEEKAKKKRAEDETRRLYTEFLESFQGDDGLGLKAFVRGRTVNDEKVKPDAGRFFPL
ncbi:hypothetical protein L2E82_37365 [Cichorium intybus]|uniref:Uncharacterized protein n=1 Tax=Cichorium intybus TaxID=13427 RepID=A0ACB9AFR4_CICIN|nr:hypothetical protein L2E82_37365 [Cichorium intybus]